MNLFASLSPIYAEMFLLVMVSVILILDLLIVNYTKTVTYLLTQVTLFCTVLILLFTHPPK